MPLSLLLAACHATAPDDLSADARIACSAPGARNLTASCTLERTVVANGTILTLRHPDGAFRRLLIARNGSIGAADGAEQPQVRQLASLTEVALGGARYRLPASLTQAAR